MNLFRASQTLAARWAWQRTKQLSDQERNVRYFCIDTAWQGLILGGISAFISVFLVRLGASSMLVSLLTSLPALIGALLSVPVGWVVARQGDLIRFTNRGRIIHRSGFLLVALAPFLFKHGLAGAVVALWVLNSIPAAFINLSWTAAVAEIIPPKDRPSVNGRRWALLSLVTAVSVAVFGYLLERVAFPRNYQIVFAASFAGGFLSIYFFSLIRLVPAPGEDPDPPPATVPLGALPTGAPALAQRLRAYVRSFVETPVFTRYLLTTFVLRMGLNLPVALYSVYWIRHLDASDLWIGWRTTASSLALIVGYYLWGKIAARRGHHLVLVACTAGVGLYPVLTGLVPSQAWLPLVALVYGFFVTGIDLAFFDTLLHVCPARKRSNFIAVNVVFANLAIFAAPMLGSLLTRWLDIRTVFFVAGGIHLLSVLLFRVFRIAMDE